MAAGEHVDAHALDDHLDQPVVHRADYPTVAGSAGRAGPRAGDGVGRAPTGRARRRAPRRRTRRCGRRTRRRRPVSRLPSEARPSMSWSTNQKTEHDDRRHVDQLVEEAEEHERGDPRPREQHEVRAERRGDRARMRRSSGRSRSGRSATWVSAGRRRRRPGRRAGTAKRPRRSSTLLPKIHRNSMLPSDVQPAAVQELARHRASRSPARGRRRRPRRDELGRDDAPRVTNARARPRRRWPSRPSS